MCPFYRCVYALGGFCVMYLLFVGMVVFALLRITRIKSEVMSHVNQLDEKQVLRFQTMAVGEITWLCLFTLMVWLWGEVSGQWTLKIECTIWKDMRNWKAWFPLCFIDWKGLSYNFFFLLHYIFGGYFLFIDSQAFSKVFLSMFALSQLCCGGKNGKPWCDLREDLLISFSQSVQGQQLLS